MVRCTAWAHFFGIFLAIVRKIWSASPGNINVRDLSPGVLRGCKFGLANFNCHVNDEMLSHGCPIYKHAISNRSLDRSKLRCPHNNATVMYSQQKKKSEDDRFSHILSDDRFDCTRLLLSLRARQTLM